MALVLWIKAMQLLDRLAPATYQRVSSSSFSCVACIGAAMVFAKEAYKTDFDRRSRQCH